MNRFEAFLLLRSKVRDRAVVRFCLAVEAVLEDLAVRFNAEASRWALAGLLHELDYEFSKNQPIRRGLVAAEMIRGEGDPADVAQAIATFRKSSSESAPLVRGLAASVAATSVILELGCSGEGLKNLEEEALVNAVDDLHDVTQARLSHLDLLRDSGISPVELLKLARVSILRIAGDVFPSHDR